MKTILILAAGICSQNLDVNLNLEGRVEIPYQQALWNYKSGRGYQKYQNNRYRNNGPTVTTINQNVINSGWINFPSSTSTFFSTSSSIPISTSSSVSSSTGISSSNPIPAPSAFPKNRNSDISAGGVLMGILVALI